MSHPNTERLTEYWQARRPALGAPARRTIDPGEFADLLPQVFILGRRDPRDLPFRLAGERVTRLHGRDLRGLNALNLWAPHDRTQIVSALDMARRMPEPIVIEACADGDDETSLIEILFAPLAGATGAVDRLMGLYQPLDMKHRIQLSPVRELTVLNIRRANAAEAPRLRLAALDGRRIA